MTGSEQNWPSTAIETLHRWVRQVSDGEPEPSLGRPGLEGWLAPSLPISFIYGGAPSSQFLSTWRRERTIQEDADGRSIYRVVLTDPSTALEATWEATLYPDLPAVEWLAYFRNGGNADTPILEQVRALDLVVATDCHDLMVYHATGGIAAPDAFEPQQTVLHRSAGGRAPGATGPAGITEFRLASAGGRSSNGPLPYFNVEATWGTYRGLVVGIGWSGQWEARLSRFNSSPPSKVEPDLRGPNPGVSTFRALDRLRLEAGMEQVLLRLHPGEQIRTLRVLLIPWEQDRIAGQNLLRRFIYRHVSPRLDGEAPLPALFCNVGIADPSGGALGAGFQFGEIAESAAQLGAEALVVDAGWYAIPAHDRPGAEVSWVHGVGNYSIRTDIFPEGLRPLAQTVRSEGMRFGLWFEPERIAEETEIFREHRDWLFPKRLDHGFIFNFGIPEARQWLTDRVSGLIDEIGIGWYRHDANANYLPAWRDNDAPDRQGISEIRYLEGLYQFWRDLLDRHPGLYIEGCASGGRRMDFEALRFHHSETPTDWIWGDPAGMQSILHGGNQWLPGVYFNNWMGAQAAPTAEDSEQKYGFFSALGGGMNLGWRLFNSRAPIDLDVGRRWLAAFRALRHLVVGDFYPLLPHTLSEGVWLASQYDRPDLGEGMIVVFRRRFCALATARVQPRAVDPDRTYSLTYQTAGREEQRSGADLLAGLAVALPDAPAHEVIHYRRR